MQQEEKEATHYFPEFQANQFCRTLNLPQAVETAQAQAALKDGVLELTLTKPTGQRRRQNQLTPRA